MSFPKEKPKIPPKPNFAPLNYCNLPKPPEHLVADFERCILKSETSSISEDSELVDVAKYVTQRPLPSLPNANVNSITMMPWFKFVDRRKAESLIANGKDGCFLVRPSSKGENCYALTLWFNKRPYNISIRKRLDNNYALGTPKELEQNFPSIEELIDNYLNEELELYSKGIVTGKIKLRTTD